MINYARGVVDIAPRTASTIFDGKAMCWVHFAEWVHIEDKLDIDVDDLHYPTGYSVMRKQKGQQQKEDDQEENKRRWRELLNVKKSTKIS